MKEQAENIKNSTNEFAKLMEDLDSKINILPKDQSETFRNHIKNSIKSYTKNKDMAEVIKNNANLIKFVETMGNDNNTGSKS